MSKKKFNFFLVSDLETQFLLCRPQYVLRSLKKEFLIVCGLTCVAQLSISSLTSGLTAKRKNNLTNKKKRINQTFIKANCNYKRSFFEDQSVSFMQIVYNFLQFFLLILPFFKYNFVNRSHKAVICIHFFSLYLKT